jgi:hypothetical protein
LEDIVSDKVHIVYPEVAGSENGKLKIALLDKGTVYEALHNSGILPDVALTWTTGLLAIFTRIIENKEALIDWVEDEKLRRLLLFTSNRMQPQIWLEIANHFYPSLATGMEELQAAVSAKHGQGEEFDPAKYQ